MDEVFQNQMPKTAFHYRVRGNAEQASKQVASLSRHARAASLTRGISMLRKINNRHNSKEKLNSNSTQMRKWTERSCQVYERLLC